MKRIIYDNILFFVVFLSLVTFTLLYLLLIFHHPPLVETEITISPEGNMTVIEYQNNEIIKYNGLEVK